MGCGKLGSVSAAAHSGVAFIEFRPSAGQIYKKEAASIIKGVVLKAK